jgi:hypothetical protein
LAEPNFIENLPAACKWINNLTILCVKKINFLILVSNQLLCSEKHSVHFICVLLEIAFSWLAVREGVLQRSCSKAGSIKHFYCKLKLALFFSKT